MTTAGSSPAKRVGPGVSAGARALAEPTEEQVLARGLDRLQKQYAADPAAATKLLAVGESKRDETLDPIEHAAYTAICLEILNLDEALTKE